jgi:hypothetical protein
MGKGPYRRGSDEDLYKGYGCKTGAIFAGRTLRLRKDRNSIEGQFEGYSSSET